jgi:hypothetical protein
MDDPKQLINRFVEALWNERRLDVADAIFAKDCVTHQLRSGVPADAVPRGPQAIKEHVAGARAKYEIGPLWTDPEFSAGIRKQLHYRNVRSGGDGSKRDRPEIKAVETYQASVSSNPEVSVCGLRDAIDSAAGKRGSGRPLFADVLRRQTVGIECACIGDKARQHDSDKSPSSLLQPANHGRYSNLSIMTSFSFFWVVLPR